MSFKEVQSLDTDFTVTLGGFDKKTKKANPTSISGYYLGTRRGLPNKYNPDKPSNMHVLQTEKGNVGVWGKTNLDMKMQGAQTGAMIRISFTGTRPSNKGNDMLLFKVEVDLDNMIEVSVSPESPYVPEGPDSGNYASDEESFDGGEEETGLDEEESQPDEVVPQRAAAPKHTATAPDAARQAKVKALLNRSKATA